MPLLLGVSVLDAAATELVQHFGSYCIFHQLISIIKLADHLLQNLVYCRWLTFFINTILWLMLYLDSETPVNVANKSDGRASSDAGTVFVIGILG